MQRPTAHPTTICASSLKNCVILQDVTARSAVITNAFHPEASLTCDFDHTRIRSFDRPTQSNNDENTAPSRRTCTALKRRFHECMSFSCFSFNRSFFLHFVLFSRAVPLRICSSNSPAASPRGRVRSVTGSTSFHSTKNSASISHAWGSKKCPISLKSSSDSLAGENV